MSGIWPFEWESHTYKKLQLGHHYHADDIKMMSQWARWHLKSPALRLFTQPFIQAQIKENIKATRHCPLCGEFTGDLWIPPDKGPITRKMFPFDDIIKCLMHRLVNII